MICVDASEVHYTWSAKHPPRVVVESGATVEVWTRDGFDGQLNHPLRGGSDPVGHVDFNRVAPLTGPISVREALPGDTVAVSIVGMHPVGPGWSVIWPATMQAEFARPSSVGSGAHVHMFTDDELQLARVIVGPATIGLRPMLGMIGAAPASGEYPTLPPCAFGGNLDIRLLGSGTTIYLPVFADGALVSFGDGHAVQGDGEVCSTGLECAMRSVVRLAVDRSRQVVEPEIATDDIYAVTAFGDSLDEAAAKATAYLHRRLVDTGHMSATDAYVLMSLAGRLVVNQVVDIPHVGVRFELPRTVLDLT